MNAELQNMKDALEVDIKCLQERAVQTPIITPLEGDALAAYFGAWACMLEYTQRITTILEGFEKRLSAIEAATVNRCVVGDDRCTREAGHDGDCF